MYEPYALTPSKNYTNRDSLISKSQGNASRYIEMPLLLNFKLTKKKIKLTINTGLTLSYWVNYRNTNKTFLKMVTLKIGRKSNRSALLRFCFFPQLSLGIGKGSFR